MPSDAPAFYLEDVDHRTRVIGADERAIISFYGDTPSGFQVEYGWNGRSIGQEEEWQVQHYNAPSLWGHGMAPKPEDSTGSSAPEHTTAAATREVQNAA